MVHVGKMNLNTVLTLLIKINSKWIRDLNINEKKNRKFLDDNLGKTLHALKCSNYFLDIISKAWSIKEVIISWTYWNEIFFSAKYGIKGIRRQATDWEKIFAKDTADKALLSKIYKEISKLTTKKVAQLKNGPRTLNDASAKKIHKGQISIWKDARKLWY